MAQWLRAVSVLAEDLALVPDTHMASHNHALGDPMLSSDFPGH